MPRIKYNHLLARGRDISFEFSLSLVQPPSKHLVTRQSSDNYVYTRWLGTGFKKGFWLINMAGYRVFEGLDDRCCYIPSPFVPSGHPRGAKKKKKKEKVKGIDPSFARLVASFFPGRTHKSDYRWRVPLERGTVCVFNTQPLTRARWFMGDTVITRGDALSAVDSFNHFAIRIIEYECVEPATTMVASLLSLFNAFLRPSLQANGNIFGCINRGEIRYVE